MKVTKFIKQKNTIIHKLTGITLVPEEQIKKVPKRKLTFNNDATACPYCHIYYLSDENIECTGCPMYKAENGCNTDRCDNHTYHQLDQWVLENTAYYDLSKWYQSIPEMVELYEKYNRQFKDK